MHEWGGQGVLWNYEIQKLQHKTKWVHFLHKLAQKRLKVYDDDLLGPCE